MKNEELQDLYPYENYADFDFVRRLKWCNATILYALEYYRTVQQAEIDYDTLMAELQSVKMRAVIALLYGALRANDGNMDLKTFGTVYKTEKLAGYIDAVIDGIKHYLPEPEGNDPQKLDEEWPDTQAELKKKKSKKKQIGDIGSGL